MSSIQRQKRSAEDLAMYDHLFLEMTDYEEVNLVMMFWSGWENMSWRIM